MRCRVRKILVTGVVCWRTDKGQNGKGSASRPKSVDNKTWAKNYERIFKHGKHHKSKRK